MQLDTTFTVMAPVDTVWETLMDFERVAGCVPGAEILNKLSEEAYQVGMKVKLGPVTMQYRGQMNVDERDAAEHRAVFSGKAQETRGQGTAQATVTLILVESNGTTQGSVSADLSLSGKAAAMGKGVISSVTEQMMGMFAGNLQSLIEETDVGAGVNAPPETAPAATPAPAASAAASHAVAPVGAAPTVFTAPVRTSPARPAPQSAPSLNAMTLAKGVIADQLADPVKLLGLLAAVAFIAYRIGRRATGR